MDNVQPDRPLPAEVVGRCVRQVELALVRGNPAEAPAAVNGLFAADGPSDERVNQHSPLAVSGAGARGK